MKKVFNFYHKIYFLAPILLQVFSIKSNPTPKSPQAIEIKNFTLSSDVISEFQSIAYVLIAIITTNTIKNTL